MQRAATAAWRGQKSFGAGLSGETGRVGVTRACLGRGCPAADSRLVAGRLRTTLRTTRSEQIVLVVTQGSAQVSRVNASISGETDSEHTYAA